MEEYAEEDIQVDPKEIENSFKRGLKRNGLEYLEEIKKMATNDYELIGEEESISKAFELLKRFVASKGNVTQLRLNDLLEFGLTPDIVSRIGYLVFQYDSISPVNSINNRQKNKAFDSKQTPDDYYADDFEEIEDEADLKSRNEDSADELYVEKSPTKQQAGGNRYARRSGGVANGENSDVSDIEDETYDLRKNVRTNGLAPNTPQQNHSGAHMHPRISPEVNVAPRRDSREAVPALKPAVQASSAFLPVSKNTATSNTPNISNINTGMAKSVNLVAAHSPSSEQPTPTSARASTASGLPSSRVSGSASRDSRVSRNGRIKTATWIETQSWRLGEKIGSGAFGEVFQGLNDKGTLFAVKRMNMTNQPAEVDNLLQEIQLMRGLSHPHIVAYLGAWVDAAQGMLYIFQEWVPGGSVAHLLTRFGPFSLGVVREYSRQIVCGLEYLHANGIIHRDIKGGNILVDANRTVKLADFGASTTVSQFNQTQVTTTVKGTPYFMAPEVLANSRYGRKGDVWAVGCTMIQMLTGEPPWKDRNLKGLVQLHLLLTSWDKGPPPYDCYVSPDARECLELCFIKDDTRRPTAEQLLQCKFLQDDELEDSLHSTSRDPLDDSGVITGLKQEMARAVSRSAVGIRGSSGSRGGGSGSGNGSGVDDTINAIDQQLQQRAARKSTSALPNHNPYSDNNNNVNNVANNNYVNAKAPSANPYGLQQLKPNVAPRASSSNPFASPASPEKIPINKWDVELPPGQFDSPAMFSNPVSAGSSSVVNTPNSNNRPSVPYISVPSPSTGNPFARGANVVRKSTAFSPAAHGSGGSGVGSAGSGVGSVGSSGITPRLVEEPAASEVFTPRITPRGTDRSDRGERGERGESGKAAGAHGIGAAGVSPLTVDSHQAHSAHSGYTTHTNPPYGYADNSPNIRDSLQVLKKRNPSASRRTPSAGSSSRAGSANSAHGGGNISSNRDSEDLTPYIDDVSDNEDNYVRHSEDRPYPLVQQDSLASIEEEALAMDLYRSRSDDSTDKHNSYRSQQVVPQQYHTNTPNNSINNNAYTRPKTQQQARPVVTTMKKSSSDFGHVDPSVYNSNVSVSSSAAGARVVSSSSSASRYRRDSNGAPSPQFQVVQVEHRPKPYPIEKKSASASVRRAAPMTQAEAASRPNTTSSSKSSHVSASAGSGSGAGGAGSRNSSAGSEHNRLSIATGRDSHSRESISRDSHSRDAHNSHSAHNTHNTHHTAQNVSSSRERQIAPAEYAYSVDESLSDDEDVWMCLGCRAENTNSSHCENCALKRGADGKRGVGAQIHRT